MTAWHSYMTQVMIGPMSPAMARNLGFSAEGCPYRGSLVCLRCPFEPAAECEYRCVAKSNGGPYPRRPDCEHRAYCKCGWDQTVRLRAWGLVG